MSEYVTLIERVAPRRRAWYWQVSRADGRRVSAGIEKVKATAEDRAAEATRWHVAADNTFGDDRFDRIEARGGVL